jgi:hypothetical protein
MGSYLLGCAELHSLLSLSVRRVQRLLQGYNLLGVGFDLLLAGITLRVATDVASKALQHNSK